MTKIVTVFFIAVVASVAHARVVDVADQAELRDAKDKCIGDMNSVLNKIYTNYISVESLLDEYSRKYLIDTVGPVVRELLDHVAKLEKIDVSKLNSELEEFDNAIDRCDTLVSQGLSNVDFVKDFTTLNWGFDVSSEEYDDFEEDYSRPISFDPITYRPKQ